MLSDHHPTAADLIPSVRRSVEAARRYLIDDEIVTVPSEVRPNIEETPPYARSGCLPRWTLPALTRPGRPRRFTTRPQSRKTGIRSTWKNIFGSTIRP